MLSSTSVLLSSDSQVCSKPLYQFYNQRKPLLSQKNTIHAYRETKEREFHITKQSESLIEASSFQESVPGESGEAEGCETQRGSPPVAQC